MIDRESSHVRSRTVDMFGLRHVFVTAAPRRPGDFLQQARSVLETLDEVFQQTGVRGTVVRQTVFLTDYENRATCGQLLREFHRAEPPVTSYLAQRPCEGCELAIEAFGVVDDGVGCPVSRPCERVAVVRYDGFDLAHVAGGSPRTAGAGVYDDLQDAFTGIERCLRGSGFGFDGVFRTWLCLEDILGSSNRMSRYAEMNRSRADFYQAVRLRSGVAFLGGSREVILPASTGVGIGGGRIVVDCVAGRTDRPDIRFIPIENPLQTPAPEYRCRESEKPPMFARAVAITDGRSAAVFVSGTASIKRSQSLHHGDVQSQLERTLDNIEALLSAENLSRHGIDGFEASPADFVSMRVYVKRPEDAAVVRPICEARFGDVPTAYLVADLCRPELLVEIEGIVSCATAAQSLRPATARSDSENR